MQPSRAMMRSCSETEIPLGRDGSGGQPDRRHAGASRRHGNEYLHRMGSLRQADALQCYADWPDPTVIVVDGPYGVAGFEGDLRTVEGLAEWYEPHISTWSARALPETTLWFWGTEVGWAEVHSTIKLHGWLYRSAHLWDKGIGHIAGNCNGNTIRRFPVVTELCVQYVRDVKLANSNGSMLPIKEWLRSEWKRSGLPLSRTNEACGVKNAATRKYFTKCHLWYFPPPDMMERIARFATAYGRPTSRPYFSLDGQSPLSANAWARMRGKWNHQHGITNVWREPALRNSERLRDSNSQVLHSNQKPLTLIQRTLLASSDPSDVVWEPFGGTCTASVAALRTGRRCFAAELDPRNYNVAKTRLHQEGDRTEYNDYSA